jgi:hypothetical protein
MLELLILVAATASTAPQVPPGAASFMRFRVDTSRRHRVVGVEVARFPRAGATRDYWFGQLRLLPGERRPRASVATTQTCPAARAPLESLERLPVPAVNVVGHDDNSLLLAVDAPLYRLEGRIQDGFGGGIVLISASDPLRKWVEELLAALEPCWRPAL